MHCNYLYTRFGCLLYGARCIRYIRVSLNRIPLSNQTLQTLPKVCNSYTAKGPAPSRICASRNPVHVSPLMYVYKHQRTGTCLARSVTAPCPVLSPSSSLPPPSSPCALIPTRRNTARFKNVIVFVFYALKNCVSLKYA
jgi:hypothetical protein